MCLAGLMMMYHQKRSYNIAIVRRRTRTHTYPTGITINELHNFQNLGARNFDLMGAELVDIVDLQYFSH